MVKKMLIALDSETQRKFEEIQDQLIIESELKTGKYVNQDQAFAEIVEAAYEKYKREV